MKINWRQRKFASEAVSTNRLTASLFLFIALAFFSPAPSLAEGYRLSPAGSFDLGRAGGRIAQVDDSSAVVQNPANMTVLTNAQIQLAPSIIYFSANFNSAAAGQSASTVDRWHFIPNAFASIPLADGKIAVGLGVTMPYGLGVHWDQNSSAFAPFTGVLRYQTPYEVNLETVNISPSAAIKLFDDQLRIGAGLDVMWSEVDLKQFYPWFLVTGNPADPDGHLDSSGDGVGVGGNLGITWQITDNQSVAVTYRSPVHVNYSGDFSADNVPAALGGGTLNSSFKTSLTFPTIVAVGYGIELPHNVRLESDVEWLQYSYFKNLPVNIGNPPPGLPTSVPENWHDSFTVGLGGDWQFTDNCVLRAGYQFYESPVPDNNLTPSIPDANNNVFTIGFGYKYGHHSLEAAYGLNFYDKRNISNDVNPAFDGKYGVTVHLFSVAYSYTF
jgi:long-chain fatty acid transport protein